MPPKRKADAVQSARKQPSRKCKASTESCESIDSAPAATIDSTCPAAGQGDVLQRQAQTVIAYATAQAADKQKSLVTAVESTVPKPVPEGDGSLSVATASAAPLRAQEQGRETAGPIVGADPSAERHPLQARLGELSPQLRRLLLLPKNQQGSEAWHADRAAMDVTASDAACCLKGTVYYSVFKTRDQLFREKTGQVRRSGGGAAAAHGTYYEQEALDKYCAQRGERPLLFGLVPHPVHIWMGASPDAVTMNNRMVEIKCPKSREIEDKVPNYYYPQIQMQLECCDLEVCDFVQYSPYGHQNRAEILMVTEVKRDRKWWAQHMPYFEAFHNEVQSYRANPPPPPRVLEL